MDAFREEELLERFEEEVDAEEEDVVVDNDDEEGVGEFSRCAAAAFGAGGRRRGCLVTSEMVNFEICRVPSVVRMASVRVGQCRCTS